MSCGLRRQRSTPDTSEVICEVIHCKDADDIQTSEMIDASLLLDESFQSASSGDEITENSYSLPTEHQSIPESAFTDN